MTIQIKVADYKSRQDAAAIADLMNCYSSDPMGGGKPLEKEVLDSLAEKLDQFPTSISVLAYDDDKPVGLVNCFMGFSTFRAKPLLNIHDVIVKNEYRGRGVAAQLFQQVEQIAREEGCCKLTLEVLSGNSVAQQFYTRAGFKPYQLDESTGQSLFWEKLLD